MPLIPLAKARFLANAVCVTSLNSAPTPPTQPWDVHAHIRPISQRGKLRRAEGLGPFRGYTEAVAGTTGLSCPPCADTGGREGIQGRRSTHHPQKASRSQCIHARDPVSLPHQGKGPASTQALVGGDKWVPFSLLVQPLAST